MTKDERELLLALSRAVGANLLMEYKNAMSVSSLMSYAMKEPPESQNAVIIREHLEKIQMLEKKVKEEGES